MLIETRNFKKLNPLHFYNDASVLPLRRIASDHKIPIYERTELLDQLISSIVDKHAPEKIGSRSELQEKPVGWSILGSVGSTAPMGEVDCGRLGPWARLTEVDLVHGRG